MGVSGITKAAQRAIMAKRRIWVRSVRRGVAYTTRGEVQTEYPALILEGKSGDFTAERRVDVVFNPRTLADAVSQLLELAGQHGPEYVAELRKRNIAVP